MKDASIAVEDELAICSKKSNLSNSHIENEKEKGKHQKYQPKIIKERNSQSLHFCAN